MPAPKRPRYLLATYGAVAVSAVAFAAQFVVDDEGDHRLRLVSLTVLTAASGYATVAQRHQPHDNRLGTAAFVALALSMALLTVHELTDSGVALAGFALAIVTSIALGLVDCLLTLRAINARIDEAVAALHEPLNGVGYGPPGRDPGVGPLGEGPPTPTPGVEPPG